MNDFIAEPEADLAFDVSRVLTPTYFDHHSHGVDAFKKVDFLFEWPDELWFVEVKDPDNPASDPARASDYIEAFKTQRLIFRELGPKARDSYLFLLLENRFL